MDIEKKRVVITMILGGILLFSILYYYLGNSLVIDSNLLQKSPESENYKVYSNPDFEFILPSDNLQSLELSESLEINASPNEYESSNLIVYSENDVQDFTIDYGSLIGDKGEINKNNLDIRVIKVWKQASSELTLSRSVDRKAETPFTLVPELLVYDDSEELRGGWETKNQEFVGGFQGKSIFFDESYVVYPSKDIINPAEGTVSFMFKPNWTGVDTSARRTLFFIGGANSSSDFIRISLETDGRLGAYYRGYSTLTTLSCSGRPAIIANDWYKVYFNWNIPNKILKFSLNDLDYSCSTNIPNDYSLISKDSLEIAVGGREFNRSVTYYGSNSIIDNLQIFNKQINVDNNNYNSIERTLFESFESEQSIINNKGRIMNGLYLPPKISKILRTDIPAKTSKQFWINLKIPSGTSSGVYLTNLTLRDSEGVIKNIELKLNVRPITLDNPEQEYMIFYTPSPQFDNLRLFKELENIKNAGFNGFYLSTFSGSAPQFETVVKYARELGFRGPIIPSNNDLIAKLIILNKYGYPNWSYGIDEPNKDDVMIKHIIISNDAHKLGANVSVAITKQTADKLNNPQDRAYDLIEPSSGKSFRELGITNEGLDLAFNHITYLTIFEELPEEYPIWNYFEGILKKTIKKSDKREGYYWQSWIQLPKINRLYSGFFLWNSEMNGIMPYVYQQIMSQREGDPFNDFDGVYVSGVSYYRDLFTTYPSLEGPIPTTQWIAMREGYDDIRYLTTLYNLITEVNKTNRVKADEVSKEIENNLAKYSEFNNRFRLNGQDFTDSRGLISSKIIEMQDYLESIKPPIEEPEEPNNGGGSGGSGGGGGGGGTFVPINSSNSNNICSSNWSCSEWGNCINGIQNRICNDLNRCLNEVNKPAVRQSCSNEETDVDSNSEPLVDLENEQNLFFNSVYIWILGVIFALGILGVTGTIVFNYGTRLSPEMIEMRRRRLIRYMKQNVDNGYSIEYLTEVIIKSGGYSKTEIEFASHIVKLQEYISQSLKLGEPINEIFNRLEQSGWKREILMRYWHN